MGVLCVQSLLKELPSVRASTVHDPPTIRHGKSLGTAGRWITVHLSLETEWSRPEPPAEGTRNNAPSCQWEPSAATIGRGPAAFARPSTLTA